jgi:hypothetical protein
VQVGILYHRGNAESYQDSASLPRTTSQKTAMRIDVE